MFFSNDLIRHLYQILNSHKSGSVFNILFIYLFIGGTGSSLPHEGFYPAAESRGYRLVAVLLAALVSLAVEHRL